MRLLSAAAVLLAVLYALVLAEARASATSPGHVTTYERVSSAAADEANVMRRGAVAGVPKYWWLSDKRQSPVYGRSPIPNPSFKQLTPPASPPPPQPTTRPPPPPGSGYLRPPPPPGAA